MNTLAVDDAILTAAGERWTKVAMVIAKVAETVESDLPDGDERYDVISNRIEALVGAGRLVARGNTNNWRSSEIRRMLGHGAQER